MTSRERILAAVAHRQPDRVPVDLGSNPSSGISAIAYNRLAAHLGIHDSRTRIYDVVQELAQPEDWFLERFGIDAVDIGRTFNERSEHWSETTLPGGWLVDYPSWFHPERKGNAYFARAADGTLLAERPEGANFFDQKVFPYLDDYPADYRGLPAAMDKVLWSALVHSPWDHGSEPGFWDDLRARTIDYRQRSDRALMVVVGCNLFEWGTFLRRIDNFLMDLLTEPEQVERLLDALMAIHLSTLGKVCEKLGDIVDIVRFGDDLGHDGGPLMAPNIYKNLFKPRHKQLVDFVKTHSKMKTFLHTCGSVYDLMPDLIDVGYDIINPVQTSARGMDAVTLKREFGRDVTFWGAGVDTRATLNRGTPAQVRDDVLRRMEVLSPGGGFVFNPIHNILPDCPPQNIVAMFAAVDEFNGR